MLRKREPRVLYEGDIVYLHFQGDGYAHSDGFVDERVGCLRADHTHAATFEGCLFRVVPKLTYEAAKALHKIKDEALDKVELLKQQAAAEAEANAAAIRHLESDGQGIVYGQIIQLQHVLSGKFLTSKAKTLADVDKTSMKVTLQADGSTKAYFTLLPRYKTRSVGSSVIFHDSVCLARAKYTSHVLHLSAAPYPRDALDRKEINMNYKESILQLQKYTECTPPSSRSLQIGKLYRLFHLEGQAYVTMSANPHATKAPYLRQIVPDSNYTASANLTLKSLYVLERLDPKEGGVVADFDDVYCFRHLATGQYLALSEDRRHHEVPLVGASADKGHSNFCLRPTFGSLGSANSTQLTFRIETPHHSEGGPYRLHNPNRAKANHALKHKASYHFVASTRLLDEDCFRLVEASATETYEAFYLSSVVQHLRRYRNDVQLALQKRVPVTHMYLTNTLTALRSLIAFLQAGGSAEEPDGRPIFQRQEQVREAKVLDTLYEMLRVVKTNRISTHDLATDPALKVILRVHRLINKVLVCAVNGNLANKNYVATRSAANYYGAFKESETTPGTYMAETLGHIGSETGSKSVYRSLFLNNKQLLEHSVDLSLVTSSCRNIEAKGVKAFGILHFLSTICACDDVNLPQNQELIVRALYSLTLQPELQTTRYSILIEAAVCPNPVRPVSPAVKDFVVSAPSGASSFAHNGHPVGYEMLNKGYVNIVVSWKAALNWDLDASSGLFFTPAELQLTPVVDAAVSNDLAQYDQLVNAAHREWILLEHVVWTLQPDDMFPLLFNGKEWATEWAEIQKDHERLEVFERLKALATYYNLQLMLFAELLRGHCATSLEILSAQLSYNMLLSAVANPGLPHTIRTSFSTMLHLCWLRRFPHEPLLLPRFVYGFDDIPKLDRQAPLLLAHFELQPGHPALASDDAFIAYPFADKFAFVQGVVHETMVLMAKDKLVLSSIDANVCLSALLVMVDWLVRCGFYPDMEAIERLLMPLLMLLDGRNTVYSPSALALVNSSQATLDDTTRYNRNKLNDALTKCKMQICDILQTINVVWRNYEVLSLLSHFKYVGFQDATTTAANDNDDDYDDGDHAASPDDSPRRRPLKKKPGKRHKKDESTRLLAPPKKHSTFLQLFAKGSLDMRSIAKLPLATICMDLMMYEDDTLVHAALALMLQLHTRQNQVLSYLGQCILVRPSVASARITSSTISSAQVLKEMEYMGPLLRHYMTSFASPSLCDQMVDVNKVPLGYAGVAHLLVEILRKFQDFCVDKLNGSDVREPNLEKQTILLQLHTHLDVMQLLRMPTTLIEPRYKANLLAVKAECCLFFQRLMARNPMGQRLVFPFLPDLIARFEELQNIGDVLIAIFVDNRDLCSSIPEEAIWTTMKLLNDLLAQLAAGADDGFSTICTILNFFTHYMIPDQVPMKSNQVHLFSVLSHPQFEHTILPFGRGIEPHMEVGSVDLMTTDGYLSLLDLVRNPNASAQLVYFQKSLELLGCVCRGKTYKTEVECQQLYPLNFILTLLLDEEMPLTLKVVAGKFLAEVFLDTDLDVDPKIGVLPAMWSVLLHCSTQIAAYNAFLYKDQAPSGAEPTPKVNVTFDELSRYVFEGNLSIVTAFFSCVYNPKADDLDDNTVHIVQALKSDIRSLKKRGKLDPAQHEICDYCGIALGLPIEKKPTLPPLRRTPSNTSTRHRNAIAKHRPNATLVETVATASSFDQFKWSLLEAPDIAASVHAELQELVDAMETIEALTDKSRPDAGADRANTITKQLLASRIMKFIADNPTSSCVVSTLEMLVRTISSKALSEDAKLRLQRAEIEEAQETYQNTQTFMATCGAARLVLTLIANAYNPGTMLKAIEFGLNLVGGGNATVQAMLYESMQVSDERFFLQIDRILQAAIEKVKETRRTIKYIAESRLAVSMPSAGHGATECSRATDNILAFTHSDADVVISGDLLIQFLSMLAEGHNLQMQLVMLDQSHVGNLVSVNLLQTVTSYLAILVKDEAQLQNMSADDCRSLDACWLFLTEYMQGPCSAIQEYLTGSVMVEIFRKTLKAHINVLDASDDTSRDLPTADAVKKLKANAVKTMVSLLEGRSDDRVEARLRSTLELKAIKNRLLELYEQYHAEKDQHKGDVAWHEQFLDEGVNLFTLAQCVFRPSGEAKADDDTLVPESTKTSKAPRRGDYASEAAFKAAKADWRHKSMYTKAYKFFDDLHCTIEVWWGTDEPRLDTVHFPLHSHCRMFAFLGHKKERLLNDFDYKSNERLKQFVQAARGLDEEMQHIEMLSRFLLYNLIRPYIPLFKTLSFILAIFMNLIMLVALKHNDESTDRHFEPNGLQQPMQYFGMLQIFLSTAVLVFMLVISVPLVFRARRNAQIKNSLDSYNANKKQRKQESLEFDLADLKAIHLQIDEVGKHLKSGLLGLTSSAKGLAQSLVQIYHAYLPLLRMILLIYLLQLTLLQAFPDFPTEVPFIILFLPFVRNTRTYLETSCSWFGLVYTLVYDVIFDKHTAFYTVYLGTACCATLYHPIFYGYHLLDLVIMSPSLQNVVRAVTKPGRALALTCLLGLFVIYFYTMVLFFFTPSDATDEVDHVPYCSTMMDCFLFFVHRGLLSGGGIGDFLTNGLNHPPNYFNRSMYWARVFFDLSFFVLVIVLLLNIVFGITIDTFGELRTEANEKERLMKNQCFICGLSRDVFDTHYTEQGISDGFAKHIASEHNMWNYLYFIVHLRAKDLTDCTGPEAYVKTLLEKDDYSWFPQGMAQCLTRANVASTERDLSDIKGQLKALSAQMEHIASVATESA